MSSVTFTCGDMNMYGDYWLKDEKKWLARVPGQADLIETICANDGLLFIAQELHAEHNAHAPLMEQLGDRWQCAAGAGGNLLLHKPELHILKLINNMMPGKRYMTRFNVLHEPSGVKFWVVNAHLSAGGTLGDVRAQQAHYLCSKTETLHRAVMGADLNSSTDRPGFPHAILAEHDWLPIRKTSLKPVVNANFSSHGSDKNGAWIEGLFTKDLVRVNWAAGIPTNGLSDHTLAFAANLTIES